MKNKLVIITGANGGMGCHITTALAKKGYSIIMACQRIETALEICDSIKKETNNENIEVRRLDLVSLKSVRDFAETLLEEKRPVYRLINNAGILTTDNRPTENGLETIVSVNYVGPYLLTRLLLPLMRPGARIINTISCTYLTGKIEKDFFTKGKNGRFSRISIYANTKLALFLFSRELAERVKEKGISVYTADPGIVSTNMIKMNAWFDPLTDIFFRPLIKTPAQGAKTAIHLALSETIENNTGNYANCKEKKTPERLAEKTLQKKLWNDTEEILSRLGFTYWDLL